MITHQNQRFEYIENGITAYLSYTIDTQNIHDFDHTLVPPELGGHGIGKMLAQHALDFARKNGWKIRASCEFVQTFLKRYPQYQDLVV